MPQDEGLDDAPFPETLSALGGVPAPPRPGDEPPILAEPDPEVQLHDRRTPGGESRRDRLVSWLRWAAAPLGFSVFLVALTLFGLLKDEPTTDAGGVPAATTPATRPTATPPVATTVPDAPTTTATPTTEPPTTQPPATEPAPGAQQVGPSADRSTSPRFGPVCGHPPGQMFEIVINGQPAPPVTADANGCVTVDR